MEARIMITTLCNMSCKYCINNEPGVLDGFRRITDADSLSSLNGIIHAYTSIKITGGEPFLFSNAVLSNFISDLRLGSGLRAKIYIYTNGMAIWRRGAFDVCGYLGVPDGLNIGIHEEFMAPEQYVELHRMIKAWQQFDRYQRKITVRYLGIEGMVSKRLLSMMKRQDMQLTMLKFNEKCDNPNEHRYYYDLAMASHKKSNP